MAAIPEISEDCSTETPRRKWVPRYQTLADIDYSSIPTVYGEKQIKHPQMVIVMEMIKNGEIIVETLDPEDADFQVKFY